MTPAPTTLLSAIDTFCLALSPLNVPTDELQHACRIFVDPASANALFSSKSVELRRPFDRFFRLLAAAYVQRTAAVVDALLTDAQLAQQLDFANWSAETAPSCRSAEYSLQSCVQHGTLADLQRLFSCQVLQPILCHFSRTQLSKLQEVFAGDRYREKIRWLLSQVTPSMQALDDVCLGTIRAADFQSFQQILTQAQQPLPRSASFLALSSTDTQLDFLTAFSRSLQTRLELRCCTGLQQDKELLSILRTYLRLPEKQALCEVPAFLSASVRTAFCQIFETVISQTQQFQLALNTPGCTTRAAELRYSFSDGLPYSELEALCLTFESVPCSLFTCVCQLLGTSFVAFLQNPRDLWSTATPNTPLLRLLSSSNVSRASAEHMLTETKTALTAEDATHCLKRLLSTENAELMLFHAHEISADTRLESYLASLQHRKTDRLIFTSAQLRLFQQLVQDGRLQLEQFSRLFQTAHMQLSATATELLLTESCKDLFFSCSETLQADIPAALFAVRSAFRAPALPKKNAISLEKLLVGCFGLQFKPRTHERLVSLWSTVLHRPLTETADVRYVLQRLGISATETADVLRTPEKCAIVRSLVWTTAAELRKLLRHSPKTGRPRF